MYRKVKGELRDRSANTKRITTFRWVAAMLVAAFAIVPSVAFAETLRSTTSTSTTAKQTTTATQPTTTQPSEQTKPAKLPEEVEAILPSQAPKAVTPGSNPGCKYERVCGWENAGYSGYGYQFKYAYENFQNLAGGCYSLDVGYTWNDCASAVWNSYGMCNGARWFWDAGFGGPAYSNAEGTGTSYVGSYWNDQFSSVVDCGY